MKSGKDTAAVSVNYMPFGFVKHEDFFELYDDLMKWKLEHAFLPGAEKVLDTDW